MKEVFEILAVALIAFLSPILSTRVKIPAVIIEIIAGFILAYFLTQQLHSEWFLFFSLMGLIFLMFLSGLEIDFSLLMKKSRENAILFAYVILSTLLSFIFVKYRSMNPIFAVFLANVSLGIVMPVMRELGLTNEKFGQNILIATFITDLITMSMLSGIILSQRVNVSLIEYILPLGLIPVFIFSYYLGRYLIWNHPEFMARFFNDPMELGVRGSFAIMILFSGIAYLLGSEAILGAFLAGALISLTFRGAGKLGQSLMGVGYGIFIPFFFIKTGSDLYHSITQTDISFVIELIIAGLFVKLTPSLLLVKKLGFRNAMAFGIVQSSKLGLTLAGADIAYSSGIITAGEAGGVALWTVITAFFYPTVFRWVVKR